MQDLVFATCLLLTSFGIGLPLAQLLPKSARMRFLAAPGLGFGTVAITTTLAYRYGLPIGMTALWLAAIAALMLAWRCLQSVREPRSVWIGVGAMTAASALTLLLCLLPKWTGGGQFAAFQGNPYDQFNYLSMAVSFKYYSYASLHEIDPKTATNNFIGWVATVRDQRPAVALVLAAFADMLRTSVVERSYSYTAVLQAMMFFPATFLILNAFRTRTMLAALGGATLTLGFPLQYVLDINAWSQLAAMPLAVLGVALVCIFLEPDEADRSPDVQSATRWIVILGVLLASLFFLYPEIFAPYGAALIGAVAVWFFCSSGRNWRTLAVGVGGALFGLLLSALYGEGTFGFLLRQAKLTSAITPDWWYFFQAYLFEHEVPRAILPINFGLALIGLYPLLPQPEIPKFLAWVWLLVDAVLLIGILATAFLAWKRARGEATDLRPWMLVGAVAGAGALLLALTVVEKYWAAGKTLSMVTPLIFFVLSTPLLFAGIVSRRLRIPTVILWCGYLGFGLIRPVATANETGVHYARPYPATMDGKAKYSWDLEQYREALLKCGAIQVDVDSPFLERYLQLYLTELGAKWFSTHPLDGYYGLAPMGVEQPRLESPDCSTTTAPQRSRTPVTINLSRDSRFQQFFGAAIGSLDLAPDSPPELMASGLHSIESYRGGFLRWTSGLVQLELPIDPSHPPTKISLRTWPIKEGRRFAISVNGREVYAGPIPADSDSREFDLGKIDSPSLKIEMAVETFRGKNDPRELGVALRELTLTK